MTTTTAAVFCSPTTTAATTNAARKMMMSSPTRCAVGGVSCRPRKGTTTTTTTTRVLCRFGLGRRSTPLEKGRASDGGRRGRCASERLVASSSSSESSSLSADGKETNVLLSQILAGVTVSLAMVPESLSFTFVAGVSPIVGLHAAGLMGLTCAIFNAQPGVISGAAGATAVVIAPLVSQKGVEYLFACCVLCGGTQVIAGVLRLGKFIRLVPQPVMLGFVNGLAIVIGKSQLEHFHGLSGAALGVTVGLTAVTMALIKLIPKYVTKKVPSPLMAIASLTALTQVFSAQLDVKTIGDISSVAGSLPQFSIPNVPVSLETLLVIAPYAISVAAVGLIETLLTQQLVDDIVEERTATHTECIAQGLGNIANGFFSGMGGCAMIGQSLLNVNSGGRTRVSGIVCASAIFSYVLFGASFIQKIPLAALAGTMLCLVLDIFDFTSFKRIARIPKTDATVLIGVTLVTVLTNLAVAVFAGVILSALGFAWKSSQRIDAVRVLGTAKDGSEEAIYYLYGPLFFGSVQNFFEKISVRKESVNNVVLDFAHSKVWDSSALVAIDELTEKFRRENVRVRLRHLSPDCTKLLKKAADLIEVSVDEDPVYAVATDYMPEVLPAITDELQEKKFKGEHMWDIGAKKKGTWSDN